MYIKKNHLSKSANNLLSSTTPPQQRISKTNNQTNKLNITESKIHTPYEMKFYITKHQNERFVNRARNSNNIRLCRQKLYDNNNGNKCYFNDFYHRFKWQTEQVSEAIDLNGRILNRSQTPLSHTTTWKEFINKTPDNSNRKDIGSTKAFNNYICSRLNTRRTIYPETDVTKIYDKTYGKKVFRSKSSANIVDLMNKSDYDKRDRGRSQIGKNTQENGKIFDFTNKNKPQSYKSLRGKVNIQSYKDNKEYAGNGKLDQGLWEKLGKKAETNKNGNYVNTNYARRHKIQQMKSNIFNFEEEYTIRKPEGILCNYYQPSAIY